MATQQSVAQIIYVPADLTSRFLQKIQDDLSESKETFGILLGQKHESGYKITDVYIPDQIQDANSCKPANHDSFDADLIEWRESHDNKFVVGWIHTHPVQNCCLTSIDQHQAYAWQCGVESAVSIVYSLLTSAIQYYQITKKGMNFLKKCQAKSKYSFHNHTMPRDQIYIKHKNIEFIHSINDQIVIHDYRAHVDCKKNSNKTNTKNDKKNNTKSNHLNENTKNSVAIMHNNYKNFGKTVLNNTWLRTHDIFEPSIIKNFLQTRLIVSKLTDVNVRVYCLH